MVPHHEIIINFYYIILLPLFFFVINIKTKRWKASSICKKSEKKSEIENYWFQLLSSKVSQNERKSWKALLFNLTVNLKWRMKCRQWHPQHETSCSRVTEIQKFVRWTLTPLYLPSNSKWIKYGNWLDSPTELSKKINVDVKAEQWKSIFLPSSLWL